MLIKEGQFFRNYYEWQKNVMETLATLKVSIVLSPNYDRHRSQAENQAGSA